MPIVYSDSIGNEQKEDSYLLEDIVNKIDGDNKNLLIVPQAVIQLVLSKYRWRKDFTDMDIAFHVAECLSFVMHSNNLNIVCEKTNPEYIGSRDRFYYLKFKKT